MAHKYNKSWETAFAEKWNIGADNHRADVRVAELTRSLPTRKSRNRCLAALDIVSLSAIRCSNGATMKKRGMLVAVAGTIVLVSTALLTGGKTARPAADETLWPTKGWATASPGSVGLD